MPGCAERDGPQTGSPPLEGLLAKAPGCPPSCARRLCLLQYEKEAFTPLSFMELFSKLNATLTDAQLSVFAGGAQQDAKGTATTLETPL